MGTRRHGRAADGAAAAVLLGAIVLAYLFADRPFATLAHGWHHPALGVDLAYLADAPLPAASVVMVVAAFRKVPRPLLAAALATLAAIALKDELKMVFGRPWPETWIRNNPSWIGNHVYGFRPFHGGAGYASFPSGHTVSITAPASVLWRTAPRLRLPAALAVGLVALGLLVSDYHFISDVLAGLLVGVAVADVVCRALSVGTRPRTPRNAVPGPDHRS